MPLPNFKWLRSSHWSFLATWSDSCLEVHVTNAKMLFVDGAARLWASLEPLFEHPYASSLLNPFLKVQVMGSYNSFTESSYLLSTSTSIYISILSLDLISQSNRRFGVVHTFVLGQFDGRISWMVVQLDTGSSMAELLGTVFCLVEWSGRVSDHHSFKLLA